MELCLSSLPPLMSIEWEADQRKRWEVLLGSDRTQQPGTQPAENAIV